MPVRFFFVLLLLTISAVFASTSQAFASDALRLEPGYWRIEVRTEAGGFMRPPTTRIDHLCLSANDIDSGMIGLASYKGCAQTPGQWGEKSLTLAYSCPVSYANASGRLDAPQSTQFTAHIHFETNPPEEGAVPLRMGFKHRGEWIQAACPEGANR